MRTASVALLAEGVDRNSRDTVYSYAEHVVALLAEGVDRNLKRGDVVDLPWSPSSRRAWIEIPSCRCRSTAASCVALLAEGVDRNHLRP